MSKRQQRKGSAFTSGKLACREGVKKIKNPFLRSNGLRKIWNAGWCDGPVNRKRELAKVQRQMMKRKEQ